MSSIPGPQTNSGNLFSIGFRFEIANLFASVILHPLNWYLPRLGYNKFSWAFTVGPFTLTQVDYAKYTKLLVDQEKQAAKELVKILEKMEEVGDSARSKFKDLTNTDYDPSKSKQDKTK
jgi:hypothetical protein